MPGRAGYVKTVMLLIRAFSKWVPVPLMVSLSNHRSALRQAQDERKTKYVATLKRPIQLRRTQFDRDRHCERSAAISLE